MFLNTFSPTRSPNPEAGSWVVAPHQGRPFGTAQKRSWFTPLRRGLAMSVLLSCLLSVASSHPVVLRTRLGRGLCRSVTLRAVSCCAQHTSLAEQRCTPGTSRKARTLN